MTHIIHWIDFPIEVSRPLDRSIQGCSFLFSVWNYKNVCKFKIKVKTIFIFFYRRYIFVRTKIILSSLLFLRLHTPVQPFGREVIFSSALNIWLAVSNACIASRSPFTFLPEHGRSVEILHDPTLADSWMTRKQ